MAAPIRNFAATSAEMPGITINPGIQAELCGKSTGYSGKIKPYWTCYGRAEKEIWPEMNWKILISIFIISPIAGLPGKGEPFITATGRAMRLSTVSG
jgi:hypothetical protein